MRLLLTTLTLALMAHAGAQDLHECGGQPGLPTGARAGVYRGTLGGRPIALSTAGTDSPGLRYTYERIGLDIVQHGEEAYSHGEGALLVVEEHRKSVRNAGESA